VILWAGTTFEILTAKIINHKKQTNMRALLKTQYGVPATNRFFFDDFFGKDIFGFNPNQQVKSTPSVNVKENETEFTLEVAAPGLQKEDFNVSVDENVLSISAEKKTETTENNEQTKFTRKEFSYHSFKRSFTLDEESVDADNIVAKYENGILNVHIPKKVKTEEVKKAKTISIL
jgi:HSP20 family protein